MAKTKKFIKGAIHHPGRVKAAAKRDGISVHQEAEKMSHSSNKSARGAGLLALRFQKGGDLHQGGSTKLKPGDMKYSMPADRKGNLAAKQEWRGSTRVPCPSA